MILADTDLQEYLEAGYIKVSPAPDLDKQLGPCSLDFRLGYQFRVFDYSRKGYIDTREPLPEDLLREVQIEDNQPFVIQPGELVLASTFESLEIPNDLMARLDGRSSLGRLGIIVHGTAGVFHPGWHGKPTLELGNVGRIAVALYPLQSVCTFTFEKLTRPSQRAYGSGPSAKYMDQDSPEPSKLWTEYQGSR
ncbi:MAG: dCTP deaminase [Dehalococcoidia bacterium]